MRYAVHDRDGRPLAMLGFSAAVWKIAPRDDFIGWTPETRERNLPLVVDNSRYLIMPWIWIPNLASHILSEVRRQLPQDWFTQYRVTPVLMEIFVETPRFSGITYKASGRIHVGTTQGRGRYDTKREFAKPKKDVWLCPLRKNWKEHSIDDSWQGHHALTETLTAGRSPPVRDDQPAGKGRQNRLLPPDLFYWLSRT